MKLPDRRALSDPDHLFLHDHDRVELHNPDPRDFTRLMYLARFEVVVETVRRHARGPRVLDVGCAQGNFSLALAEHGFRVVPLDLRRSFLSYLRMKHERGAVACVNGSLEHFPFRARAFDVVLLGEVIEHVAHPERLLESAARLLAHGGVLVVTTPNGERAHTGLPTLSAVRDRAALEQKQFKPDADGHLFLLTKAELTAAASAAGLRVVEHAFFNSPWMTGRLRFRHGARLLPVSARRALDRWTVRTAGLARALCEGQILVAKGLTNGS